MRLSRAGLTLAAAAVLAASSAIIWNTVYAMPDRPVDRAQAHDLNLSTADPNLAHQLQSQSPTSGTPTSGGSGKSQAVDPGRDAASVAYLQSEYGVSKTEADRRLALQVEADQLDATLRASQPDSYAGMWLDQAHGGLLRVATTKPTAVKSAVARMPDGAHIVAVRVTRSLRQLNTLADQVRNQVPDSAGQVTVDVTTNQVAIYQASGAEAAGKLARTTQSLDAAQKHVANPDPSLTAIVAAHTGVVLRQLVIGESKSGFVAAQPGCQQNCPAPAPAPARANVPLRAGSKLVIKRTSANTDSDNMNVDYGECTLGFVVFDPAKGAYYGLTAAHCLAGPDKVGITTAYDDNLTVIGSEVPTYEDGSDAGSSTYPTDYGLIAIPNTAFWFARFPKNLTDVHCTSVQSAGCSNGSITVTGVRSYSSGAAIGEVVCATGAGSNDKYGYKSSQLPPGTRCGEITGTNGGFVTNICSRKGDSGGPLFSEATGKAYGILNDGSAGTSTCAGNEWSQYSAVSVIMAAINQQDIAAGGPGHLALRTAS